jgi:GGDEF domain-containing protein
MISKPTTTPTAFLLGDQIIQKSASFLREISRESDFLARISGDEMGMIITGLEHPTQAASPGSKAHVYQFTKIEYR